LQGSRAWDQDHTQVMGMILQDFGNKITFLCQHKLCVRGLWKGGRNNPSVVHLIFIQLKTEGHIYINDSKGCVTVIFS